ncbi:winged helix-turn-helix domain-containing protein [Halobaculum sp. MBLA0147]|uniref:winged helix-turn-helix domain-containing protein n=1 Tax=Halobaculum sp. MBLA0147 TaxID=3079934 RepID=UPI0035248C1C
MTTGSGERLWEGDVNEAAVEEWVDETTAFDRVRTVAETTSDPQSASEVADRARVSEPTARKYLESLLEAGLVTAVSTGNGTRYVRSPQSLAVDRIASIHREHTRDEIGSAIERFRDELAALRDTYGVADADALVDRLDADETGWQDVHRWRETEERLAVARAALALYDFDPDDTRTAVTRLAYAGHADGDRGAFASGTDESTTGNDESTA